MVLALSRYMGTYGAEDEEENDNLFLYSWEPRSKWQVVEGATVASARLDLVTVTINQPLQR